MFPLSLGLLDVLGQSLSSLWSQLSDSTYDVLDWAVNLLPGSPFTFLKNTDLTSGMDEMMHMVNYWVPFAQMVVVALTWLTAIVTWYMIQIIMRWIKAIE